MFFWWDSSLIFSVCVFFCLRMRVIWIVLGVMLNDVILYLLRLMMVDIWVLFDLMMISVGFVFEKVMMLWL